MRLSANPDHLSRIDHNEPSIEPDCPSADAVEPILQDRRAPNCATSARSATARAETESREQGAPPTRRRDADTYGDALDEVFRRATSGDAAT